jgi:uncharacterized protein YceH (UPF0502 family)
MEPLTPEELRVVACLVEKQLTTPDSYPLTENAVVSACNQLSNRNPVVAYDNNTVRVTLTALRQRGLARVIHTPGARVPKHRHLLDDALGLSPGEVALVTVLALRGPQTVGELRTRTERMHEFASLSEVEEVLEGLASRDEPFVVRLERQPGQKEARYAQLLAGPPDAAVATAPGYAASPGSRSEEPLDAPASSADASSDWAEEVRPARAPAPAAGRPAAAIDAERIAALEKRLGDVESELAILQAEHHELRQELGLGARRPPPADPDAGPMLEPD